MKAASAFVCAAVLLLGCAKKLEHRECQLLLDRYVELLLHEDRKGAGAGEVLRLQLEARKKAQRDPAFGACRERVSRRSFDCAMAAEDANRLEQCLL